MIEPPRLCRENVTKRLRSGLIGRSHFNDPAAAEARSRAAKMRALCRELQQFDDGE